MEPFRLILPWGLCLFFIGVAAIALGSDDPIASLFFSIPIMLAIGVTAALRRVPMPTYGYGLIALPVALFAIALFRGWASSGAGEHATLLAGIGLFLVARAGSRNRDRARVLWDITLVAGTVLGCVGFFDTLLNPDQILWMDRPDVSFRLSTPFLSPNTAGAYFSLLTIMALARGLDAWEQRTAERAKVLIIPILALVVGIICQVLSGSRGAMAGLIIVITGLAIWSLVSGRMRRGKSSPLTFVVAVVAIAGLAGLVAGGEAVFGRLTSLFSGEVQSARSVMFAAYVDSVGIAPFFGHGLGGFTFVNALSADASNASTIMYQNAAHNIVLQWLLQTGLIGTAALVILAGLVLRELVKGLGRRNSQRALIVGGLAAGAFALLHGFVDFALEIPAFMWLFAWNVGLASGVASGGHGTRTVARPIASFVLAVAMGGGAILSGIALLDRIDAAAIGELDDESFTLRFADGAITGSATKALAIGDRALRAGPEGGPIAVRAFEHAVLREPRDAVAWAKLALARLQADPGDFRAVVSALEVSYLQMPYAPVRFREWRTGFALQAWPLLDDVTRAAAAREARLLPDGAREDWFDRTRTR